MPYLADNYINTFLPALDPARDQAMVARWVSEISEAMPGARVFAIKADGGWLDQPAWMASWAEDQLAMLKSVSDWANPDP